MLGVDGVDVYSTGREENGQDDHGDEDDEDEKSGAAALVEKSKRPRQAHLNLLKLKKIICLRRPLSWSSFACAIPEMNNKGRFFSCPII